MGLDRFVKELVLSIPTESNQIQNSMQKNAITTNAKTIFDIRYDNLLNSLPVFLNLLAFFITFAWVVAHWVIYHKLIDVYPYAENIKKFAIDIVSFGIVFMILFVSPTIYNQQSILPFSSFSLFVLLFALFHILRWRWFTIDIKKHISNSRYRSNRGPDIRKLATHGYYEENHVLMFIVYVVIFIVFVLCAYAPSSFESKGIVLQGIIIIAIIVPGIYIAFRLYTFLPKKTPLMKLESPDAPPIGIQHYDTTRFPEKLCYWYHILAKNRHKEKIALNCSVYLKEYKIIKTYHERIPGRAIDPVEFKWKGVRSQEIIIPPEGERYIDAFYMVQDEIDNITHANYVHLGINENLVDYSGYLEQYTLNEGSNYELTFRLISSTFPGIQETFILHCLGESKSKLHVDGDGNSTCNHCNLLK